MVINTPYLEHPKSMYPKRKTYQNYNTQNYISKTEKPLKDRSLNSTQPTFKGFSISNAWKFITKSERPLVEKAVEELDNLLPRGKNDGADFVRKEMVEILSHREKWISNGFDPEKFDRVRTINSVGESFFKAVKAPFEAVFNGFNRIFGDKKTKAHLKDVKKVKDLKQSLAGYLLEARQQSDWLTESFKALKGLKGKELDKVIGDEKALKKFLKEKGKLRELKPDKLREVIEESGGIESFKKALQGDANNEFVQNLKKNYIGRIINDKDHKKQGSYITRYGSDGAFIINRGVSGIATGAFVGTDFYNLAMANSGDKEEANKKRKQRWGQTLAYTGLYTAIGYVLNATFSRASNRSLPIAIGIGAAVSLAANVISRVTSGMPLLPKKPEDAKKEPFVLHSLELKNNDNSTSLNKYHAFKGRNKEVSFSGNPVKAAVNTVGDWFVEIMPARTKFSDFKKAYNVLEEVGTDQSKNNKKKLLEIARQFNGLQENATLKDIANAADSNGFIKSGKNEAFRIGRALVKTVTFPFEVLSNAGRMALNVGRNIAGKDPIPAPKAEKFDESLFIQHIIKSTEKGKDFVGEELSKLHGPQVLAYPGHRLSTFMKATGLISVPFYAVDAYNDTMDKTKNTNISMAKSKQRLIQDGTRQTVSFWAVKSFNDVFKSIMNQNLLGNAVGVLLSVAGYEAVTRVAVGQPLTTKNHEQMKEIEKKKLKSHSWLHNVFGGKVRAHENKVVVGSAKLINNNVSSETSYDRFIHLKKNYNV